MALRGSQGAANSGQDHRQNQGILSLRRGASSSPERLPSAPYSPWHWPWGYSRDALTRPSPAPPPRSIHQHRVAEPARREGFRAAADGGGVRWPDQAPPPRPGLPPPELPAPGPRPRCCGVCSRRRRRRRERPWRRAPGPARALRAGAAPAQVRAAPPSPLHRHSFLFSISPPSRPPRLPSVHCSSPFGPKSSSLHPAADPDPVSIFPGCVLPTPAASSLAVPALSPLHLVSPVQSCFQPWRLQTLQPLLPRRLRRAGRGWGGLGPVRECRGGERLWPRTPSHTHLPPPSPLFPSTHHLTLPASLMAPALSLPSLPISSLSPLGLRDTHPFCVCRGEEPGTEGAEEVGQFRAGSPQAQLEGLLRERSRRAGQREPSTSTRIKNPRVPRG